MIEPNGGVTMAETAPTSPALAPWRERLAARPETLAAAGQKLRQDWQLYVLLAPLAIWFAVFLFWPMAGLRIAFKDFSLYLGLVHSPYIGFENFAALWGDSQFWRAVGNTLTISAYSLLFAFPVPILLALMFNEIGNDRWRRAVQVVAYLPHFISVVIIAGLVIALASPSTGPLNVLREKMGLDPIYFLTVPGYFRTIFIGSNVWKEAGFESIVYLAAISGISPSLYEAAKLDGASRLQLIRYVTLPSILPVILVMLIIRIGNMIEVGFEYIVLLYQPATYETADVIATYMYRVGLQGTDYGLAAAAGLANAVVALLLVWGANRFSRRVSTGGLW